MRLTDEVARSVCRSIGLSRSWVLQKRLNRSRCRLGCELRWVKDAIIRWGCTLALPGEYDWTVRVRRRCSLYVKLLWPRVISMTTEATDDRLMHAIRYVAASSITGVDWRVPSRSRCKIPCGTHPASRTIPARDQHGSRVEIFRTTTRPIITTIIRWLPVTSTICYRPSWNRRHRLATQRLAGPRELRLAALVFRLRPALHPDWLVRLWQQVTAKPWSNLWVTRVFRLNLL